MSEHNVGDRFRSNRGGGPLLADITGADEAFFYLVRWDPASKVQTRTQFKLSREYMESPACGWVTEVDGE